MGRKNAEAVAVEKIGTRPYQGNNSLSVNDLKLQIAQILDLKS